MQRLYFVRHGLSEMNRISQFAGHTDTPLVKEGREQARKAGKQAKALDIDTIVSSPLSRALDTAKIIAGEIGYPVDKIHSSSLLLERFYGQAEGSPWGPDVNLDGFSDVETWDAVTKRAELALEWIRTLGGKNVLVASHGSLGRAMRSLLVPEADFRERLENAEIHQWL